MQDEQDRRQGGRPWRQFANPLNKPASDPNYPEQSFNHDEWMKSANPSSDQTPSPGDTIRINKTDVEAKVERIGEDGFVYFRVGDGELMKTPSNNVTVIQPLADEDEELMELSNALLSRYKTGAGKDASAADKKGDYEKGNKRFSGIVKATKKQFDNDAKKTKTDEGSMGGINRVPDLGLSHEDILSEVMEKWLAERDQIAFDVENPPQYPVARPPARNQNPTIDPFKGDPAKQAKAPKNARMGNADVPFSELVQDTIKTHGIKWAFEYYVKKHGLPPRQFKIFAGL